MKLRSFAIFFALLLVAAAAAMAHGDKKHIIGTVEKIGADSITIKQGDGTLVEVKLVASTSFVSVGADKTAQPAKLSDLQVGKRVVIHATPKPDNTFEAAEVRFSSASAAAPAASKPN